MSKAAVALVVLAAACKGGDRKTIARGDGGAPPVQVVDRGGAVTPPGAPEVEPNGLGGYVENAYGNSEAEYLTDVLREKAKSFIGDSVSRGFGK